jgi:short-subunit dehydrogenase
MSVRICLVSLVTLPDNRTERFLLSSYSSSQRSCDSCSTLCAWELARCCVREGIDVLIAADEPEIERAAEELRAENKVEVNAVQTDLSTVEGVDRLCAAARTARGRIDGNAADIVRAGFDAMMRGEGDIVTGMANKIQSSIANVTPAAVLARQHRKMAEPGTAEPQQNES